jgi:hypothetical protein
METECVYCAVRSAHTVYLCVLCGSENKQRLFYFTALTDWFLGAFAKLRNATVRFVVSCLSIRLEHLGSYQTDFDETSDLSLFRKFEDQISLKSDKNNGYFT